MSKKRLDVDVNVRSKNAEQRLKSLHKSIRNTGKAAKTASNDFVKFNRTMFTTTAFVGLFTVAFRRLSDSLLQASRMDRVVNQFERSMGPKGQLFQAISSMTDNSINRMEALRSGLALSSLGIMKNMNQMAEFIARAGTAAKMAGMDSSEGIKRFTRFMKDGSVAHLEFLNLIRSTNPQLMIQLAALRKYGDIAGGALSATQRHIIGLKLLRAATQSTLMGQRDIADSLLDIGQAFKFLAKDTMLFIGSALAPMIDNITKGVFHLSGFLDRTRKTNKELITLVKMVTLTAGAVAGLVAVNGLLKLSMLALGSLGTGIPMLIGIVGTLGLAFLGITHNVDTLQEKWRVFTSVFKGSYQLISSFLGITENYKRGIGQMDKSTHDLLRRHGLLDLVKNLARVGSILVKLGTGVYKGFRDTLVGIGNAIGFVMNKFSKLFGIDIGSWSKNLLTNFETVGKGIGSLLAIFAALKLFKVGGGLLSKLPFIGRLIPKFGGLFGKKGTPSNPVYVRLADRSGWLTPTTGAKPRSPISLILPAAFAAAIGEVIGKAIDKHFGKEIDDMLEGFLFKRETELSGSKHALAIVTMLKSIGKKSFSAEEITARTKEFIDKYLPAYGKDAIEAYKLMNIGRARGEELESPYISPRFGAVGGVSLEELRRRVPVRPGEMPLAPREVQIPKFPKGLEQEQLKSSIITTINTLAEEQKVKAKEAYKAAMDELSASGKTITPEEYSRIFKYAFGEALAPMVKATQETASNTVKTEATSTVKRSGIC